MSLRLRVLKGAAVLSAGQALGQVLSFVRNIIVARLLEPADFGIAATFAITVSLLEMISDLAADKLIIQAKDGDAPQLQATAQLYQVGRGVCSAVLIAAAAYPVSRLFGTPQAQWAFYVLGLVPLLRGLIHLDVKRLQREMQFLPQVSAEVGSQALVTALAWPLAAWLRDYSAMLWLTIIQAGALALISHLSARRRYAWALDGVQMRRLTVFGWPLLANGVLMFAIFHGDRLLIGAGYTMRDLGVYSVAITLAMSPGMLLGSIMTSLMLPLLSTVQGYPERFRVRYALCTASLAFLGAALSIVFCAVGGALLVLLFGAAYSSGAMLIALLGIAQGIRLTRVGPAIGAMACGDSQNLFESNLWRVATVGAAAAVTFLHFGLVWFAVCAIVGEVLALAHSLAQLRRRHGIAIGACLRPVGAATSVLVLALVLSGGVSSPHWGWGAVLALVEVATAGAGVVWIAPELAAELRLFVVRAARSMGLLAEQARSDVR